jgi:hypothetical protein
MRGEASGGTRAPAGRPLVLKLDAKGLPPSGSYRLEIVDASGAALFEAAVKRESDGIAAALPKRLESGRYWVRVYEPRAAGSLLREFGLTVE